MKRLVSNVCVLDKLIASFVPNYTKMELRGRRNRIEDFKKRFSCENINSLTFDELLTYLKDLWASWQGRRLPFMRRAIEEEGFANVLNKIREFVCQTWRKKGLTQQDALNMLAFKECGIS